MRLLIDDEVDRPGMEAGTEDSWRLTGTLIGRRLTFKESFVVCVHCMVLDSNPGLPSGKLGLYSEILNNEVIP